jgi:hypothetical protein
MSNDSTNKVKERLDSAVTRTDKIIKDKFEYIQNVVVAEDNVTEDLPKSETFEATITLARNVYDILKLLVQFESDNNDLNAYVSEVLRREILRIQDDDHGVFREYVKRKLQKESY